MESFREKAAFIGGIGAAVRRIAPQAGAKLMGSMKPLAQGLGGEMKRQALGGALIGGVLEGGMGAAAAEDGQKGRAFAKGLLHGGATGAAMGAATAPITTAGRNLRLSTLGKMGPVDAAKATYDRGYLGTLKDVATGKGALGRRGAALEAVAAPAQLAAEMALPAAAMGALGVGTPPPPEQVRTAADEQEAAGPKFEPVYIAPFTSTTGAGLVDSAIDRFAPNMQHGFLRKRALPALGAAALTIPTVKAIRAMNPEPEPLEDIDVDALKYYFGKTPQ